jgi:RNA polymerase sigma factor (sigma-70 family)
MLKKKPISFYSGNSKSDIHPEKDILWGFILPEGFLIDRKYFTYVVLAMEKLAMDAEQRIFEHYRTILKIVQVKSAQYGLDYDGCLNFVLNELRKNDHQKISAFRGESRFTTYLTVVVHRLIFTFARKNKKLPEIPDEMTETPLDILIEKQEKALTESVLREIPRLLDELGFMEKLILKMRFYKGFNISRISRELSMTRYEVKNTMESGLDLLREKVNQSGEK